MLTRIELEVCFPQGTAPSVVRGVLDFMSDRDDVTQVELQQFLIARGLVAPEATSLSRSIHLAWNTATTPSSTVHRPVVISGTASTASSPARVPAPCVSVLRSPVGLVAVIGVILAIAAAVVYYLDSNTVNETFKTIMTDMPTIAGDAAKAELKSAFGKEFLAAAPTWAKPAGLGCSIAEPRYSEDCLANEEPACAMLCCDRKAQKYGTVGAFCRIQVRNALGPPSSYPPPPPTTPSS